MIPSPKVSKHVNAIKKDQLSRDELREPLRVIAHDFDIPIEVDKEGQDEDFCNLSTEESHLFNDLLGRATEDLREKRYTEYRKTLTANK